MTLTFPIAPHDDLAVAHDRARRDAVHAEDADLGVIDERCHEEAAELAGARDGEGRAAELLRQELPGACPLGERVDVGAQLVEAALPAGADDGHDEPLVGLHRDAEVVAVEVDDLVAFEPGVQLGELLQRERGRAQHRGEQQLQVERR